MRPILAAALVTVALMASACSRPDADKLKQDSQAVGHDVATDVRKVGDDPNIKAAGSELKSAAQEAGHDLHKAGDDISTHAKQAAEDTRDAAQNK